MRSLLLAITSCLVALIALPVTAADLLIIQSQRREVYDQAVRLVQNSCGSSSETMVMGDYAEFDLGRIVREEQPRVVLAIGEQAFREARKLHRTPVVYSHTLNINEESLPDNVVGVSMHVAPANYMKLFKKLQLIRIGVLFDPKNSGSYLERAKDAAAASGIELVPLKVTSPREVPAALAKLKSQGIKGLWMIPDSTAVARESLDSYFLFAQQQNLPVISFAKGYLAKGAVAVLEGSRQSITAQSCAIINKLRSGASTNNLDSVDIRKGTLHLNETIANKLQLQLSGLERIFPVAEE